MEKPVEEADEIVFKKPLDENFVFVITVSLLLIIASSANPYDDTNDITPAIPACHIITGEILNKEIQNENHYIYVELLIDDDYDGYIVEVRESTYDAYEIGDTYESVTCDAEWFDMFRDTIQELLDAGIIEQLS